MKNTPSAATLVSRRKAWLKKQGLTIREFADSVSCDYNSAFRWITLPRHLQRLYLERVLQFHPSFPAR